MSFEGKSLRELILEANNYQYKIYNEVASGASHKSVRPLVEAREAIKRYLESVSLSDFTSSDGGQKLKFSEPSGLLRHFTKSSNCTVVGYDNDLFSKSSRRDQIIAQSRQVSSAWASALSTRELYALRQYCLSSDEYSRSKAGTSNYPLRKEVAQAVHKAPTMKPFVVMSGVNSYYAQDFLMQASRGAVKLDKVISASFNPAQVNGFISPQTPRVALEIMTNRGAFTTSITPRIDEMEVLVPEGNYKVVNILENIKYVWGDRGSGLLIDKVIQISV